MLPAALVLIRTVLHYNHHARVHLELFTRGLLVPERPDLLRFYIADRIKRFLSNKDVWPLLPALGRTLYLHWSEPLNFIRTVPDTRRVVRQLSRIYRAPLIHALSVSQPQLVCAASERCFVGSHRMCVCVCACLRI